MKTKTTPEQRATLARAAQIYAYATGNSEAASLDEVRNNPNTLELIAAALESVAGGTSPLASELRALPKGGE